MTSFDFGNVAAPDVRMHTRKPYLLGTAKISLEFRPPPHCRFERLAMLVDGYCMEIELDDRREVDAVELILVAIEELESLQRDAEGADCIEDTEAGDAEGIPVMDVGRQGGVHAGKSFIRWRSIVLPSRLFVGCRTVLEAKKSSRPDETDKRSRSVGPSGETEYEHLGVV